MVFMTQWKPIPKMEDRYEISDDGRVASLNYNRMGIRAILRPYDVRGYKLVVLQKNGFKKAHQIHRLVANAFIENTANSEQVNHKDGVKSNNDFRNLEWVTCSENTLHSFRIGKSSQKGERNANTTLTNEDVRKIKELLRIKTHTQKEIGAIFGVSEDTIGMIKRGVTWSHIK